MSCRRAYAIVVAACALPRLVLLAYERSAVLEDFEKSKVLAQMFLQNGTFGYVPGHPSAYTQPLYGWFLIPIFWVAGFHWWSVGTVQILVAVATSLLVLEIGRRFLSLRVGLLAAVIATLQPYLVWHDIHGNREILDQLLGAAMFLLALTAARRRTLATGVALGVVSGVAILSNSRLVLLPLVFAAFLAWRHARWPVLVAVPALALVALAPWVVRNKVDVGCWAITTDARALWKANNVNTYSTLAHGLWIDQVVDKADIPQREVKPIPPAWLTPEEAGGYYKAYGRVIAVPECAQTAHYEHLVFQFWEHHPGEKVKLAAQATRMLWDPRVQSGGGPASSGGARSLVEALYVVPLYLLAIAGLFLVEPALRVLALSFVFYETVAAWVFAGTTRYRVPWDFVLALLAAVALERLWARLRARSG
jgi:4-amino-4-deoxy-L-arabinose transferase-like glycosyltransferase